MSGLSQHRRAGLFLFTLVLLSGTVLGLQDSAPAHAADEELLIRLKNRTFIPGRANSMAHTPASPGRYRLLQFDQLPEPETLRAHGIEPLNHVLDNAVLARVDNPAAVDTLAGLRWQGILAPSDKWSHEADALLDSELTAILVVEAFPDVTDAQLETLVATAGGQYRKTRAMPSYMRLVTGDRTVFDHIASDERIAWMMPADNRLINDEPLYYCSGAMTQYGPVGNFASVGPGWDGPGRGPAALTYFFINGTPDIAGTAEESTVVDAMDEWAKYADLSFSTTTMAGQNKSIDILWASGSHGDTDPFDGANGVLAHAFFPAPNPNPETIAGDMHFDEAESWSLTGDIHMFTVALHELGHALGLLHSNVNGAVMQAFYGGPVSGLHPDDIAGIQTLYSGGPVAYVPCPAIAATCTDAGFPRASLRLRHRPQKTSRNRFSLRARSTETPLNFFGDPTKTLQAGGESHVTCLYDSGENLILELGVTAAGVNERGRPLWRRRAKPRSQPSRFINNYRLRDGNEDGVYRVRQRDGTRSSLTVRAKGSDLAIDIGDFTDDGLTIQHIVTDQISDSSSCSQIFFPPGTIKLDIDKGKLSAKIRP